MAIGSFNNSVTGVDGQLAISQIISPNFSITDKTGWAILQSGLAYFFEVVITGGTIVGDDWVLNDQGLFFYNGAPGEGNLIVSIAPAAGTDAFGNNYPQGGFIFAGDIDGTLLAAGTVNTLAIAQNAITTQLLALEAVGAQQIAPGTVVQGIIDSTIVNAAVFNGSVFEGSDFQINPTGAFFYAPM